MDISSVKLRKTQTRDSSRLISTNALLCENSEQYQTLMEETYLEKYYETIKEFTFPTVFLPLSKEAARSISTAHKRFKEVNHYEDNEHLRKLAADLSNLQREVGWKEIFIRLSSRSPKDAVLSRIDFGEAISEELDFVEREERDLPNYTNRSVNQKLHALYRASTYALKVQDGEAAVKLLIESDRIQGDIEEYLKRTEEDFNVAIREFRTFDPDLEFRGFIYKGNLTALTQYNEFVYFPVIEMRKSNILEQILQEFNQALLPRIPLENYVIDFVLCPETEEIFNQREDRFQQLKVWVIEVNPLAEFAGSGLFSWVQDKDVLLGKTAFEFRTLSECPSFALESLPPAWKKYVVGE